MKQIFTIIALLISTTVFGQGTNYFANGRPTDTAANKGSLRIDSIVRFLAYANQDSNKVIGVDAGGKLVLRTKGGTIFTDTLLPYFFTASDFNAAISNYYTQTQSDARYIQSETDPLSYHFADTNQNTKPATYNYLLANFFKQGGVTWGVPAIIGTTDNYSLHFLTNNTDRGFIDSVGNTSIGNKGYAPYGVNAMFMGNSDTLRGSTSSTASNTLIGSILQIGDGTSDFIFDRFIGTRIKVYNNGYTMNYAHAFGPNITYYQKSNSNTATFAVGSNITDSVNNSGQDYGNLLFGYQITNNGKKSVTVIGKKGNHNVTSIYHTQKDDETVLLSTGEIRFYTGGKDNAIVITDTGGNLLVNKTATSAALDTYKVDVNGNAKIGTNLTVGSSVILSSLLNGIGQGKSLTTKSDGSLTLIPIDTTFNPHGLTLADFGVLPDWKRISWVSHTSGSHTITAPTGTFAISDIGKVIYIPRARQFLSYSTDTLGITGKINGFINSGSVTIDSNISLTSIDSTAYFGTNWYDTMQYIANYCVSHNVGRLMADGAGTYLLCPKLSRTAATQSPDLRGIQITAPLSISGAGSNITYFKWSVEDDIHTNSAENYQWNGFVDNTQGGFKLSHMTLLAPDRACLSYTPADSSGAAVTVNSALNKHGSTVLEDMRIIGDSSGKKPYWQLQWPNAVQASTTDTIGYYTLSLTNSAVQSCYQNITFFTPRGGKKLFQLNHVKTYNSGSPLMGTLFVNAATIANGSPTLTLHSTPAYPNPSWYKFTSDVVTNYQYTVYLYNGVDTFSARTVTIVNDTVITLDRNATHAFTLANMQSKGVQNIGYSEGQNMYIHPTINIEFNDVEAIDAAELAIQHYSSHGNLPGQAEFRHYTNCRSTVGAMGITDLGWLLGNGNKVTNILRDCDFQIYSLGHAMQIQAWNCNFRNLSPFYDTSELHNCKGSIYITGSPMQMNIYGGNYSNIYIHQLDSGTTNIYGDSVTLIANNSTHNGVVNVYNSTVVGATSGVGSILYYTVRGIPLAEYTITDGATVTLNGSNGINQKVILGGARTLAFSNPTVGLTYILKVVQDATGSRTLTYPASVKWTNGVAPTLTTTANAVDIMSFYYDGTNYYGTYGNNFK